MKTLLSSIHTASRKLGKAVGFLPIIMMLIITYEVFRRYALGNPTKWAWLTNKQLFGVFVLLAGIYTMSQAAHIRIEIFYERFSPKMKMISRVISLLFFMFFMGCLIWQGAWMGLEALSVKEKATGFFAMPLYPLKLLIPIVSFFFLLEGIALFFLGKDK